MKRYLYILTLLFALILPVGIRAREGITNYYIDATILSNGDINVKEIFTMNGSFNGMNRFIDYIGNYTPFDGSIESFKGSNIYNGDSIIINEIKGIPYSNTIDYSYINKSGTVFEEVSYANKGDYGVYTKSNTSGGIDMLIYNPSTKKNAFYIDYTITNMAIVHNDIGELGFNIFTKLSEYVHDLEMYIHIPNNGDLLKVWAHGPLWGESQIIDKNTVKLSIKDLEAYTGIDVRLAFSKSVLSESTKITNVDALDKIIKLETELADIANKERDEAKKIVEKQKRVEFFGNIEKTSWLVFLFIIIYVVYIRHDKEYKKQLDTKYFRDFPSDNEPAIVGYLIRKNITNDDLSASILMLIYKKILTFEKIENKKKDYDLIYNKTDNLTENDKKLIEFLFCTTMGAIKDKEVVSLSRIKENAENRYEKFLRKYTKWKNSVDSDARAKNFYEKKSSIKFFSILYSILGLFFVSYGNYGYYSYTTIINGILAVSSIISLIYFIAFTKRTKEANLEYIHWIGLKKFMEDFGRMDTKELPEIVLWEKYLVYAVTLGCADKLAKDMEIKAKELQEIDSSATGISNYAFDYYNFNNLTNFNRIMNRAVNSSMSTAYNARSVANSSYSSGSGSGGGFSGGFSSGGGGGSFGGGGGGGRF